MATTDGVTRPTRHTGDLMRPREAAQYLGVSTKTVLRWIHDGSLPYRQLPSGRYRLSREEIDAALAQVSMGHDGNGTEAH